MFRRVLATAVLSLATLGVLATPGGAASKPNPCKLLKTGEISQQFGGATVAPGTAGFATAITKSCEFEVAESADFPDGSVHVSVMTTGGKVAYDAHKKKPEYGYVPATGMSNALWADKTHALEALKGTALVTVQPVFISAKTLPIQQVDTEAQAVALLKLALKRA
jgi:hypothetical protein